MYHTKKIKLEFDEIFENCDIIITPTVPTTALKIGERENDPVEMYKDDKYTVAVNIAGLPAISTPCGYGEGGLPIGMSIVGRAFEEDLIIAVADRFERDFKRQEAWF